MKKFIRLKHHFKCLIVICLLVSYNPIIYAQANPNTITFDNKSGELGLVKLIGPTEQIIEVPNAQSRTVNVATGEYYILVRYGSKPNDFKYSKGDPFNVTQTDKEYSVNSITLHKVEDGNYKSNPISAEEFNAKKMEEKNESAELLKSKKSNWLLNASQDNEKILRQIGKYIETFYNVAPKYIFDDDDKLILIYDQKVGDSPETKIYIESIPTSEIKDGENYMVQERRIRISIYISVSELISNETFRNNLLELNNKWHSSTWIPHRIFITKNESIAMQSSVNIPGEDFPIPIEQIKDIISRTLTTWEEYSAELLKMLNQSKK